MADETTTAVPEAEPAAAPVEHTAEAADPNAIEHALDVLAAGQPTAPAVEKIEPGDDETFEPLGTVLNCP
ncbi:hypothetical protein GCM10009759_40970 [Kitasatospora saccharophila]|uniref:Uncharacterized protein n=1 Tax=Kitasatospora saccharophila TaxID=407973 RepID=A0ABN2X4D4_9ACTN